RARVPNVRLEVVGDGPHGPALRAQATRLGLNGAVEFLGFLPAADKVRRLQASWALLQPSPKEGWGLTTVEAAACGTAVVASDARGLRDAVRRDETGLLVRFGDVSGLADALVRVLSDAALRERLAAAGLEWAARFRWDECGRRTLDALTGEARA